VRISSIFACTMQLIALAGCGAAVQSGSGAPGPSAELSCRSLPEGLSAQHVVALPLEERDALQKRLLEGPVAVTLEGCRLVVVQGCEMRASATYEANPLEASITLTSADDVEREMPLGTRSLTPRLSSGGPLRVTLLVAGQFSYGGAAISPSSVEACKQATHVIASYGVGAFEIADASGAVIDKSGDRQGCARASGSTSAPPAGCSDVLAVKLVPLGGAPSKEAADSDSDGVTDDAKKAVAKQKKRAGSFDGDQGMPAGEEMMEGSGGIEEEEEKDKVDSPAAPAPGRGCDPRDPMCMFVKRGP
jgi:hypothetical protein